MAPNFAGPWQLRLNYTTVYNGVTLPHQHRVNINVTIAGNVGDPFSAFTVLLKGGSTQLLSGMWVAYLAVIDDLWENLTSLIDVELWKYTPGTNDAAWYSAQTVGITGVSSSPTVEAGQLILTFRTEGGGSMRLDFMETVRNASVSDFPPLDALYAPIAALLVGGNGAAVARDDTFPAVVVAAHPGQNEAIWKRRNRP